MSTDFDPADWAIDEFKLENSRYAGDYVIYRASGIFYASHIDNVVKYMISQKIPRSNHYYIKKFNRLVKL